MRFVAAPEDPDVARKILACLDLPPRTPPSGGEPAWEFDQTALDEEGIG